MTGVRPKVLVLLAAFNGAAWIEEQVSSILFQVGVDVQIVIADDASSDDSVQLVEARWGDESRVRVIRWTESSGSAGANFLRLFCHVDISAFDFVALADQDDVWFNSKLAAAVAALNMHGAAGYSAAVLARWPDGSETILCQCGKTRRADFLFEGAGQGCTFVLDKHFFARVQQFLRQNMESALSLHYHDWLIYLLSRAWGELWVFDPAPRMSYRQHGGNEIGARGRSSGFIRRFNLIREGWYAAQIATACTVYLRAAGSDAAVVSLGHALARREERRFDESMQLAFRLMQEGRRRLSDRGILFVCVLLRWI